MAEVSKISPNGVCDWCAGIDWEFIFKGIEKGSDPPDDIHILDLGRVSSWNVDSCAFCLLLYVMRICPGNDNGANYSLKAITTSRILFGEVVQGLRYNSVAFGVIPSYLNFDHLELHDQLRSPGFICRVDDNDGNKRDSAKECRTDIVMPGKINLPALMGWLKNCIKNHGHRHRTKTWLQESDHAGSSPLRMIDCQTQRIVRVSRSEAYVALSYTWGSTKTSRDRSRSVVSSGSSTLPSQTP